MKRRKTLPHVQIPVLLIQEPCLLRPADAAKLLKVAPRTLRHWRWRKHLRGPSFVKLPGGVRYELQVLRDYIARETVRTPLPVPRLIAERKQRIDAVLKEVSRHPRKERQK